MKVAVTGATGFIGRALTGALRAAGHEPLPVDLRASDVGLLPGADALVHLAAIAHRAESASELRRVNVALAEELGRVAANRGLPMLFLSSVKVHGEHADTALRETSPIAPCDAYGASKAQAESALRAIPSLRLTVLRPPLVYGPGVKANFLLLMRSLARGIPLPLASVVNRRSLIYVGNLADAIERCLRAGTQGTYLLSDGPAVPTPDLCRLLARALGRRALLFRFPPALIPLRSLTCSLEVDDSALRREVSWRPRFALEEGLQATADWYRGR